MNLLNSNPSGYYIFIVVVPILILDLLVPLGVAVGVLYVSGFVFVFNGSKKAIVLYSTLTIVLTLLVMIVTWTPETSWIVYTNRGISVLAIFIITYFTYRYKRLKKATERKEAMDRKKIDKILSELSAVKDMVNQHLMVLVTNTKGEIIFANDNICQTSKFPRNELLGKSIDVLGSSDDTKFESKNIMQVVDKGKIWFDEVRNFANDGSVFWTSTEIIPVTNEKGKIVRNIVLKISIDDRKRKEQVETQRMKELEETMYLISHGIQKPVDEILHNVNELKKDPLCAQACLPHATLIGRSALKLDSFIDKMKMYLKTSKLKFTSGL